MSAAAAVEVKGWCPGVLRPMQSGDGLIARVRPWCGAFGIAEAAALADAAERFGNGHIDLTRRANLQIRGLDEARLPALQAALAGLDLIDGDVSAEAARNIMVAPLAGIDPAERLDVRPLARALARGLAAEGALHDLPSKFGFLVDGGGVVSIAGERADILLCAAGRSIAVGLDTAAGTDWIGATPSDAASDAAVDTALAAARAFLAVRRGERRLRDLGGGAAARLRATLASRLESLHGAPPSATTRPLGMLDLGTGRVAVGISAAFGRLEAPQLRRLVAAAGQAGATDIRLSPWRSVYVAVRDAGAAQRLVETARAIGLIVEAGDPVLRIDACPGAPACLSSSVDTRRTARRFAALGLDGSLHVSGCAKGCARSGPADLVLVGDRGRYNVIRNGTARDTPVRSIGAAEAGDSLDV